MGQGILIHLLQVAMTMIQVNVISGLPHLCTQRLEIFHSSSFAFSAFFAVEPIWRLRIVQTKRTQRKPRGERQSLGPAPATVAIARWLRSVDVSNKEIQKVSQILVGQRFLRRGGKEAQRTKATAQKQSQSPTCRAEFHPRDLAETRNKV